jgi:hypothetical protein
MAEFFKDLFFEGHGASRTISFYYTPVGRHSGPFWSQAAMVRIIAKELPVV